MVAYKKTEIVGITEFSKSVSSFIEQVSSYSIEKLVIVRHNKPEAVIVPIDEYERMKNLYEAIEHQEIEEIVNERSSTNEDDFITLDELKTKLKLRGINV